MAKQTNRIVFDGLDNADGHGHIPTWYRDRNGANSATQLPNFMSAVQSLPRATKLRTGYYDTDADEWREAGYYRVLANPEWLGDGLANAPDGRDDAVWHIPTVGYDLVNPVDAYGPLVAMFRRAGIVGAFGVIREYGHGKEVHLDIFFRDLDARTGKTDFLFGLTTGYDFTGRQSHYTRVAALNMTDRHVMRHLTDAEKRRSAKSRTAGSAGKTAEQLADWWATEVDRLDNATDVMLAVVAEARDYYIADSYGFDAAEFYEAQGLPEYLAAGDSTREGATGRLRKRTLPNDERGWSAWDLYRAGAAAVSEDYDGKDGTRSLRSHMSAVNRILFEPAQAESKALNAVASRLQKQATLGGGQSSKLQTVRERHESLAEARDSARSMRDRLSEMLDAAEEDTESADDENGEESEATA